MNAARLAQLHRQRAEALRELAELEEQLAAVYEAPGEADDGEPKPANQNAPRRRKTRVITPIVPPETTDTDVAAAKAEARKRGIPIR